MLPYRKDFWTLITFSFVGSASPVAINLPAEVFDYLPYAPLSDERFASCAPPDPRTGSGSKSLTDEVEIFTDK